MQNIYTSPIKKLLLLLIPAVFVIQKANAQQAEYIPYSYQFDQKLNASVYSLNSDFHTALKPFRAEDSSVTARYRHLMQLGVDTSYKQWAWRKLFNEHLFDDHRQGYTFFADYLPDLQIGREFSNKDNTFINTRGYQLGGTIGSNFYFYSSGYEDQARFPLYYKSYVNEIGFVPGEAYDRDVPTSAVADWSYVTAIMSYSPNKHINITLGQDKTFIGDGYRSLLLSDWAATYPLLRFTANIGPVQYMMMWTNMEDINLPGFDSYGNNRRKWAEFHYFDWNVTNRLSLGLFNSIIIGAADNNGIMHGFDINYVNPVFFASSIGTKTPYPDNVLTGFTGKYKILNKTAIYGQLLFDRFNEGTAPANTGGFQLGFRGADLFGVNNLNYLAEYNTVKPYTYSSPQVITNYTDYSQSLGDPLGANFKEAIGILNYSMGKFDLQGEMEYAQMGLDPNNTEDFGINLLLAFPPPPLPATSTGAGVTTHLYYGEGTLSYLINPKYNLRLEGGVLLRDEKNALMNSKTTMITFGLRSTFRDLYHDF
jgi:hypothetical protein